MNSALEHNTHNFIQPAEVIEYDFSALESAIINNNDSNSGVNQFGPVYDPATASNTTTTLWSRVSRLVYNIFGWESASVISTNDSNV